MMTHHYNLSGLTCKSCIEDTKHALLMMPEVLSADVTMKSATITMDTHIPLEKLQAAIGKNGRYTISEAGHQSMETETPPAKGLKTYQPLLLVAAFITGVSYLAAFGHDGFDAMMWMNFFMAGFFIAFSFFKFLDLRAFADSYAMYDIIAKRWKPYAYIYPFIELALGIAFVTGFYPVFTTIATLVVMSVSIVGVVQSVLNKRQIKCACLGAVFNLPMSTVTIVEDAIMIVMAIFSLFFIA